MKSGRVNFCPGELFLKLLARIGEWHQNLSEKTALMSYVGAGAWGLIAVSPEDTVLFSN